MTTYGRGLANEFIKAAQGLGMEILGHEGITQGEKDFTPLLTKVKGMEADLIYFAGMYPEGALLIKQKAALGLPAFFMGGDGLFEPTLIDLAGASVAEGAYTTALGADIRNIPTAKEFVRQFEAKYGHLGAYSSYSYEAMRLVLEVIHQTGKKDRAAVLAAMKQLKEYPGILGLHTFNSRGDTTNRVIGIYQIKNGKFKFVEAATVSS